MDRESRDPFELLDEIEKTLALDTAPMTWPIGRGRDFLGTYDLADDGVRLLDGERRQDRSTAATDRRRRISPAATPISTSPGIEELALAREACKPFDLEAFREGHLTPVFFGTALRNFGVARPARGARRVRAAAARAGGRPRKVEADRAAHERLRVQDPGQHGSQPPRPHRLRARLLGQARARHEGEAGAHRQADEPVGAAILLRPGPRRSPTRPLPATSSAFPTTARCGSATR